MLRSRLNQRESIRDTFWLGRVQGEQGEISLAQASFQRAKEAWEVSSTENPELANLDSRMSGRVA